MHSLKKNGFIIVKLPSFPLRHFASLPFLLSTNGALPDLRFEHGVIGGAGAPKFFAGDHMPDVDHDEGEGEHAEYDGQDI